MRIHFQERDFDGNITDFYFNEKEFLAEFSNSDGEKYNCHDEYLNNIGVWIENARVKSINKGGKITTK